MKLTQLFKIYWPDNGGGIATVIQQIADGFRDWKQEIIVCRDKRGKATEDDEYDGIPVHRCRQLFDFASTPFSVRFLRDVKKRTEDADIVLYHFPYPMIDLAVLFRLYSGKLVVWWHCDYEQYKKLVPLYRPFVRHTLKKAERILVSADGNIDASPDLRRFRDKCTVIPFCVNDRYLREGGEYLAQEPEKKDRVRILFVGRMVWYKGCDVLLRAFAQMKNKDCELVLVGGGPMEQEWRALAEKMNLTQVRFTGMVSEDEKIEQIKACDFLVLPSTSKAEAFALVQIEDMAFGKPVINTALPSGVPDVSIDGETGITVEPENESALAAAMDRMAADEALRQQYGQNARKRVEQEYTKDQMIGRCRKVFGELGKNESAI